MPVVSPSDSPVPTLMTPAAKAALCLAAAGILRELNLPVPTTAVIVDACVVSRSRAYVMKERLDAALPAIFDRPTGRPERASAPAHHPLATDLLNYLYEHPGSVSGTGERRTYSDGFRHTVMDLCDRHPELLLEDVATLSAVPLGTIKGWRVGQDTSAPKQVAATPPKPPDIKGVYLQTLLAQWSQWEGPVAAFCDHVQRHCRIAWGRTMIQRMLEATGVRIPRRRAGRSPDETALSGAFLTWFPHAQWEGDGCQVPVLIDGELIVFNLELIVDSHTSALLGAVVTSTEDSAAVVDAFRAAIAASGTPPLALLLDNKPSNHTDGVEAALGTTQLMRSTPYRPQNKPHIEGAFGLLKPNLDGLELNTSGTRQELAASFLGGLVTAVARVLNHRPRRDRDGKSRFQLLDETATPEQVEAAQKALQELQARQEKARRTRIARQNPVARGRLRAAYQALEFDDPKGHFLTATARYPLDAIIDGIAIFQAKRRAGTLPDDVDARYLLGIVRNIAAERETMELAATLYQQRIAARDAISRTLEHARAAIETTILDVDARLASFITAATDTDSEFERAFWLHAATDIVTVDAAATQRRYQRAARIIGNTHALPYRQRNATLRWLAGMIWPTR